MASDDVIVLAPTMHTTSYWHRQTGPLCWIVYTLAIIIFALAWVLHEAPFVQAILLATGTTLLPLAGCFHHLTVADEGEWLSIQFGPIPVFQCRVAYRNITSAEIGRTTILDGWGIHLSLRGGWVWNLWGRDCVIVRLQRGTLRIGTDDAANLARFLKGKIAEQNGT